MGNALLERIDRAGKGSETLPLPAFRLTAAVPDVRAVSHCQRGQKTHTRLDVTDQLVATRTQERRWRPQGPQSAAPTKPLPAGNRTVPPACLTSLETTQPTFADEGRSLWPPLLAAHALSLRIAQAAIEGAPCIVSPAQRMFETNNPFLFYHISNSLRPQQVTKYRANNLPQLRGRPIDFDLPTRESRNLVRVEDDARVANATL